MGEKMMAVEKENQVPDVEVTRYDITNMVYFIRNQQVMLDSDLAMLYQVETKNLNKAMKRNGQRFPKDFCFQLSKEEYDNLRFQIGTSSLEDKMCIRDSPKPSDAECDDGSGHGSGSDPV